MLLEMDGIDKAYGGVPALRGASFAVEAGEVHALIGQNGAGKSTLIKVLTGYTRRDAGQVRFRGQDFAPAGPQAAQAAGISTIYQEISLVGQRSITENICLGRETRRFGLLHWRRMHGEAAALLGRFGVQVDVRRALASYPTAVQQMVAIARAIAFQAALVVMDDRPRRSATPRCRCCSVSSGSSGPRASPSCSSAISSTNCMPCATG